MLALQRARDTRWGSYFNSNRSLLCMFEDTCEGNYSLHGDTDAAHDAIKLLDFIFLLHLMKDLLGISHDLCQSL